jgi:tetratricopeptide (TPR) repeat protein
MGNDDYFSLLHVGEEASEAEIKAAFMRAVRKHPPHKDPEKYKKLRQAYECLSSEPDRKAYIKNINSGGEISKLQGQIDRSFVAEEWGSAESQCKRLLVLDPENDSCRNQLALAQWRGGNWSKSFATYEKLNSRDHGVLQYHLNEAQVLTDVIQNNKNLGSYWPRAIACCEKAMSIDPAESGPILQLGVIAFFQDDTDKALHQFRKAIHADGEVDFHDLESYLWICRTYAVLSDRSSYQSTVQDIDKILDQESVEFASSLFAQEGAELAEIEQLELAKWFLETANGFLHRFGKSDGRIDEALSILSKVTVQSLGGDEGGCVGCFWMIVGLGALASMFS